ncbi:MAG: hypothetical protein R2713_08535 [Ilumatobacteraceae bacterium]
MRGLATFSSWDAVRDAAEGTPIDTRSLPASGAPPAYASGASVNAALVAVFSQALQVTFVALLLTLFFSVFGFSRSPRQPPARGPASIRCTCCSASTSTAGRS